MKTHTAPARSTFAAALLLTILLGAFPQHAAAEKGFVSGLQTYPLRDTPQFSAIAAARLSVGTQLEVMERKEGWVRVRAGEKAGWMPDSVVGKKAPAVVRLAPLQERAEEAEARLKRLARDNEGFNERNASLEERVAALQEELDEARELASGARSSRRLQGMAIGGAFILFGWVTGYALASRSGQAKSKGRLIID